MSTINIALATLVFVWCATGVLRFRAIALKDPLQ
jgi:hypothetical protein